MTGEPVVPADEQRRRSAASMFLKVYDLDEAAAESSERPVPRLCNLMIAEALLANGDELRILAPAAGPAAIQLHRAGAWIDIMRVPAPVQLPLVNRLKVMANLDIAKRPLQEGTVRVRLRAQVLPLAITVRRVGDLEEVSLRFPPRTAVAPEPAPAP